jgi:hypothetical protein
MIAACACKHPQQDALHGVGKRVFNRMLKGSYRCTVCLAMRNVAEASSVATETVISNVTPSKAKRPT